MEESTRTKVNQGWCSLVLSLCLVSCGGVKKPEKEPADAAIKAKFAEAVLRLERGHLENGWVVTRKLDGSTEHEGEGLLWTGVWLSAAPCQSADASSAMLRATITKLEGALVRYLPLGEYAGGREVTLDGALGLYRGIAERIERCSEGDGWAPVVKDHLVFLKSHNNKLHPKVKAQLVKEFTYVLDLLAYKLGLRAKPSSDRLRLLEAQLTGWATSVMAAKAAAYRIHLAYLALSTVETLGEKVNWLAFCTASDGVDIPVLDHRCGRGDLKGWINAFQFNEWEYRHQRSGAWESPDGKGYVTPGLDLITAIHDAYAL